MNDKRIGMSVDEFLDHTTGGGGQRSNFLGNWRKEAPHKIVVALHTQVGLLARWSHNWPRIVVRTDRDTNAQRREVWGGQWVCHERELNLTKQRVRDENDVREYPPEVCPLCTMIEVVRAAVSRGELSWTEPVFRFQGDDAEHEVVLTAGGLYNAFSRRDLSQEEKVELRKAGIRVSEAWRENTIARCQYTFAVVDIEHPENGVQITDEAEALGKAMQKAIRDEIDRNGGGEVGKQKGNPLRNPYPFLWEYKEEEEFANKYRAVAMSASALPEAVRELIVDTDPPDLTQHMKPGNVAQLRADMERSALVELPWDEIFGEAEHRAARDGDAPEPAKPAAKPEPAQPHPLGDDDFPPEPSTPAADEELYVCDHCEFDGLHATDRECPKCKSTFDADGNLTARPCVECCSLVPLGNQQQTICEVCATIHTVKTWTRVVEPPPKPAAEASKRRSAAAAKPEPTPPAAEAPPPARKAIGGTKADRIPWGKR